MVIITGMWSEAVAGPVGNWILWNIRELARAMSGEVEQLPRRRVGKSGPKYWSKLL